MGGGTMASLYTRSADRERLAPRQCGKLTNDKRTSIAAPVHPVRPSERKTKMKIKGKIFSEWCGREDSNLHVLPR